VLQRVELGILGRVGGLEGGDLGRLRGERRERVLDLLRDPTAVGACLSFLGDNGDRDQGRDRGPGDHGRAPESELGLELSLDPLETLDRRQRTCVLNFLHVDSSLPAAGSREDEATHSDARDRQDSSMAASFRRHPRKATGGTSPRG